LQNDRGITFNNATLLFLVDTNAPGAHRQQTEAFDLRARTKKERDILKKLFDAGDFSNPAAAVVRAMPFCCVTLGHPGGPSIFTATRRRHVCLAGAHL
jgi:hypothetical protein